MNGESIHKLDPFASALIYFLGATPGMSQSKLAKKVGCGQSQISKIVKGRNLGSANIRAKIAEVFGYSVETFTDFGDSISGVFDKKKLDNEAKELLGLTGIRPSDVKHYSIFKKASSFLDIDTSKILIDAKKRSELLKSLTSKLDYLSIEELRMIDSIAGHNIEQHELQNVLFETLDSYIEATKNLFKNIENSSIEVKPIEQSGKKAISKLAELLAENLPPVNDQKEEIDD